MGVKKTALIGTSPFIGEEGVISPFSVKGERERKREGRRRGEREKEKKCCIIWVGLKFVFTMDAKHILTCQND